MKKISRFATLLIFTASFTMPLLAVAQLMPPAQLPSNDAAGSVNQTYLRFYYDLVLTVVNSYFVPILIAIAFIVFLWGVYKYFIYNAENESEKAEGRKFILWGIIGLVVITSVWGLVNIVKDTLIPSSAKSTAPPYPKL